MKLFSYFLSGRRYVQLEDGRSVGERDDSKRAAEVAFTATTKDHPRKHPSKSGQIHRKRSKPD